MEGTRGPGGGGGVGVRWGCGKTNSFFSWERISMGRGGSEGGRGKRYILRELISGLEVRTRKEYRLILIDQVHT